MLLLLFLLLTLVARKRKLFKFELRNVVILEFNLWENSRAMYTILDCSIRLGGSIRARTTRTVNISWTLASWSGLLLRARHGFGLCRWAL